MSDYSSSEEIDEIPTFVPEYTAVKVFDINEWVENYVAEKRKEAEQIKHEYYENINSYERMLKKAIKKGQKTLELKVDEHTSKYSAIANWNTNIQFDKAFETFIRTVQEKGYPITYKEQQDRIGYGSDKEYNHYKHLIISLK